jgi:hypothetical protein
MILKISQLPAASDAPAPSLHHGPSHVTSNTWNCPPHHRFQSTPHRERPSVTLKSTPPVGQTQ